MPPLIERNLETIRALWREYGVVRLELFGSGATADFDAKGSDIDFLVSYPDDYDFGPWHGRFHAVQRALGDLLGHKVDLVDAASLRDPWFRREAAKTRQAVYEASDLAQIA